LYSPGNKRDRQYGSISEIRQDHLKRYFFAAEVLKEGRVLDAACGCGYGSWILHNARNDVTAVDIEPEAIAYGQRYYQGPAYICQSAEDTKGEWDAFVTFETLEHLASPEILLGNVKAQTLIASVPNENLNPFNPELFKEDKYPHRRHYTPEQFEALLKMGGYKVMEWFCQKDKVGDIHTGSDGIFLIAYCSRLP
jgi:SAM-dependent methyltransferase